MRVLKFMWSGLIAVGVLAASIAQSSAEPLKIRASWTVPVANWPSLLLEKKDLAKHLGQSYVLEDVRFNGTPPMITALAAGEIEIGDLAYSSIALAVENAGMDDLRVIADEFQDGVANHYTNEFFVLADGPVQKIEDLKGKVIATNAVGSAVDIAMRAMLRKHGLEDKRDYTVVEAPFPTMKAMLAEKKVVHAKRRCRNHANDRVGGAQGFSGQESCCHGRFHGGCAAYRALVHGSRQS
jgi:sulfonate transport system substrate-binding protein